MTAHPHLRHGAAVAGFAALLAFAVFSGRTESPPAAVMAAALQVACSSCDARHARLGERRLGALEVLN